MQSPKKPFRWRRDEIATNGWAFAAAVKKARDGQGETRSILGPLRSIVYKWMVKMNAIELSITPILSQYHNNERSKYSYSYIVTFETAFTVVTVLEKDRIWRTPGKASTGARKNRKIRHLTKRSPKPQSRITTIMYHSLAVYIYTRSVGIHRPTNRTTTSETPLPLEPVYHTGAQ